MTRDDDALKRFAASRPRAPIPRLMWDCIVILVGTVVTVAVYNGYVVPEAPYLPRMDEYAWGIGIAGAYGIRGIILIVRERRRR